MPEPIRSHRTGFRRRLTVTLLLTTTLLGGCQSSYYAAMERSGVSREEIFIQRLPQAQDSLQEAQTLFRHTLRTFEARPPTQAQLLQAHADSLQASRNTHYRIGLLEEVAETLPAASLSDPDYQPTALAIRRSDQSIEAFPEHLENELEYLERHPGPLPVARQRLLLKQLDALIAQIQDSVMQAEYFIRARRQRNTRH